MPKLSLKDLDNFLPKEIEELDLMVLMQFGSHLYGTDGPDSDLDLKGIYMPTREQILLNRIPKSVSYKTKSDGDSKNTAEDIDIEVYSLHYFLKLASEGQTVALDMLHAPVDWPLVTSDMWLTLRLNREMFYTKSLKAFVGYARHQAAKYGIKGSRLEACRNVLHFLDSKIQHSKAYHSCLDIPRLKDVWDELPRGEHIHDDRLAPNDLRMYQVCGKSFQETAKVDYVRNILKIFFDQYGERARMAANNEGIDWKAVSHAIRAAAQTLELLTKGRITFPLPNAAYIKAVKEGKMDFNTKVQPLLEIYMSACEQASELSSFPEKTDQNAVDSWLLHALDEWYEENVFDWGSV